MLCRDASLVKHLTNAKHIHALKCRCWSCERCAPERQQDLRGLARRGHPTKFITLTVRPREGQTPTQRAQELAHAFKLLRDRARKRFKLKHFPFLAIFEKTRRGEPHLHILTRTRFLAQRWISDQMRDLIDAPVVDIRTVRDQRKASAYVSKYIAKAPERWEGCKRYWRSQDWELAKEKWTKPIEADGVFWSTSLSRPEVLIAIALGDGDRVSHNGTCWIIQPGRAPP